MFKTFLIICLLSISTAYAQLKPEVAFTIKEKDLIPEGITYDAVDKNFYVGSIYKRKIIKISSKGVVSDYVKSSTENNLLEVLGMKVDEKNRRLWVCNNSAEHDTVNRISNIHVFDLRNGALIKRYQIEERKKHLFNDLVLTSSGDAYITDSDGGGVYVIRKDKDFLEEFIKPGTFRYPNGITLTPDERKLLVATAGGLGILKIDLATKEVSRLVSKRYLIIGIDGLYQHNNTLIGVQNVTFPESILQFHVNDTATEIEKIKFLASYDARFDVPTTGVVAGGYFYFIANSQLFQLIGNQGAIAKPDLLKDIVIMRVKL